MDDVISRKRAKIKPEVLAFLKKVKKKKGKEKPTNRACTGQVKIEEGHHPEVKDERTVHESKDAITLQPERNIVTKIADKKGKLEDLVQAANAVLKGVGKVNFVAVKGTGVVAKLNNGELNPIPQGNVEELSSDEGTSFSQTKISFKESKVSVEGTSLMKQRERPGKPLVLRPYKCTRCNVRPFQTKAEIEFHVSCHPAVGYTECGYQCPVSSCQLNKKVYSRLIEHIAVNHPEIIKALMDTETVTSVYGKFACQVTSCKKRFQLKARLDNHMKSAHANNLTCLHCSFTFQGMSKTSFKLHEEKCQGLEYQCVRCDYKSDTKRNIELHTMIHEGGFRCEICSKVFATKNRLKTHMISHNESGPKYKCTQCDAQFARNDALKKHHRRIHEDNVEKLQCPHCTYESKMSADLNRHIVMVHQKLFHCSECNFHTNSKKQWSDHKQYHKPEKVYSCPYSVCYFKAENYSELHDHLTEIHKIRAKHQCPICCKYFKKRTHLVRHLVSHTGEKVYKCGECSAAFMSHSSYYRHRKKTDHDKGREGILSVPQNIVIEFDDNTAKLMVEQHNESVKQQLDLALARGQSNGVISPQNHMDKVQMMCIDVHGTLHAVQDHSLFFNQCSEAQAMSTQQQTVGDVSEVPSLLNTEEDFAFTEARHSTDGEKTTHDLSTNKSMFLQVNTMLPQENNSSESSRICFINSDEYSLRSGQMVYSSDGTGSNNNKTYSCNATDSENIDSTVRKNILKVLELDENDDITFRYDPQGEVDQLSNILKKQEHVVSGIQYESNTNNIPYKFNVGPTINDQLFNTTRNGSHFVDASPANVIQELQNSVTTTQPSASYLVPVEKSINTLQASPTINTLQVSPTETSMNQIVKSIALAAEDNSNIKSVIGSEHIQETDSHTSNLIHKPQFVQDVHSLDAEEQSLAFVVKSTDQEPNEISAAVDQLVYDTLN